MPASQLRRLATTPASPRYLAAKPAHCLVPTVVHTAVPTPTCCLRLLPPCPCSCLAAAPGVVPLLRHTCCRSAP
ncbi:hypothetical protein NL676_007369 [Syzygium grande]|nr:hypothetical protein NL676_007369 [Syzygium grande]